MSAQMPARRAMIPLTIVFGGILGIAEPVAADPMEDICHSRARIESGYRKPVTSLGPTGRGSVRLSGSASVGVSSSRGAVSPGGVAPPFAGSASQERFEQERNDKKAQRYQRIYVDCMTGR